MRLVGRGLTKAELESKSAEQQRDWLPKWPMWPKEQFQQVTPTCLIRCVWLWFKGESAC